MNGNFKVRCIDLRGQNLDTYKIGKAYEVVNGKLISERDCPIGGYFTSIEDVNRFSASKFELITGNQSIVIYRKGRHDRHSQRGQDGHLYRKSNLQSHGYMVG